MVRGVTWQFVHLALFFYIGVESRATCPAGGFKTSPVGSAVLSSSISELPEAGGRMARGRGWEAPASTTRAIVG